MVKEGRGVGGEFEGWNDGVRRNGMGWVVRLGVWKMPFFGSQLTWRI